MRLRAAYWIDKGRLEVSVLVHEKRFSGSLTGGISGTLPALKAWMPSSFRWVRQTANAVRSMLR